MLRLPIPKLIDNFGASVSISSDGNTLVVGADGEDSEALALMEMIRSMVHSPRERRMFLAEVVALGHSKPM